MLGSPGEQSASVTANEASPGDGPRRNARRATTTPYVFVCYAHDERDLVVGLVEWLRSQGCQVWYDEAIEAGSRWSDDLAHAVEGCAAFLYLLSPRSISSRYCLDEVHFALECGRPIVPVEIAPVSLTPGLKLSIGGTTGCSCTAWSRASSAASSCVACRMPWRVPPPRIPSSRVRRGAPPAPRTDVRRELAARRVRDRRALAAFIAMMIAAR